MDILDPTVGQVVERLTHDPDQSTSLSQDNVTSIALDDNNAMWLGTHWGLNRYEGQGKFTRYAGRYNSIRDLPASGVNHVYTGIPGHIWIATGDRGLCIYKPSTNDFDR